MRPCGGTSNWTYRTYQTISNTILRNIFIFPRSKQKFPILSNNYLFVKQPIKQSFQDLLLPIVFLYIVLRRVFSFPRRFLAGRFKAGIGKTYQIPLYNKQYFSDFFQTFSNNLLRNLNIFPDFCYKIVINK